MKTPLIYDTELWEISGHWEKYRDNMFLIPKEEKTYGLKPMNCPGHMLLFGSQLRSYRELPVRFAESSTLHRDEPGGTLHGLLRVRHMTQDDAHIFCSAEQIEDEIFGCLDFVAYLYEPVRDGGPLRALDAAGEQAGHRRGVGLHRGGAPRERSSARASTTS